MAKCIWLPLVERTYVCAWCGRIIGVAPNQTPNVEKMRDCIPLELRDCPHREVYDNLPHCNLVPQIAEVNEPCVITAKYCKECENQKLQKINLVTVTLAIRHARKYGNDEEIKRKYINYLGQRGLGDAVEKALSMIGITKERVEKWLGSCYGCSERQRKLNELGAWAKRALGMESDAEAELRELLGL
jgi:hypothetical protein